MLPISWRTQRCALSLATGYELCCPREYEAQVYEYFFVWAMTLDLDAVHCPIKVIGGDPTSPISFMPSMRLDRLVLTDYDFVPETSHLLQLEEPETCASFTLEFLRDLEFV